MSRIEESNGLGDVDATALPEWTALREAIREYGPAPCTEVPDAWFPTGRAWHHRAEDDEMALVARICASCPLQRECGAYAFAAGERHGVWAGRLHTEKTPSVGRRTS